MSMTESCSETMQELQRALSEVDRDLKIVADSEEIGLTNAARADLVRRKLIHRRHEIEQQVKGLLDLPKDYSYVNTEREPYSARCRCTATIIKPTDIEGSFAWAVVQMKEGLVVRRKAWLAGARIYKDKKRRFVTMCSERGIKEWLPYFEDFDKLDWEVVSGV